MKDTTEILHLMEEGTKCQDHDMNRAKEAFRRAQVSFICRRTNAHNNNILYVIYAAYNSYMICGKI